MWKMFTISNMILIADTSVTAGVISMTVTNYYTLRNVYDMYLNYLVKNTIIDSTDALIHKGTGTRKY